ncbi:MAG: translation elongation factor Ts [Candidatus Nealsonbacteria bacterium]
MDINQLKQLRQETNVSVSECKKALKEAKGDTEKAKSLLREWGKEVAANKKERITNHGIIDCYVHSNKKIGVLLELNCETDFVAKSLDFNNLAHELCLQIASNRDEQTELISQSWIKDESKTIKDLVNEYITKIGENIIIKRFERYEL